MTVIDILLIILILAATALCLYVIFSLKKMNLQIELMRKDMKQLVDSTFPVLNNLNEVTEKINRVVSEAEGYWDDIDRSIKNFKSKISDLTSLSKFRDAEIPAKDLIKNLRAFFKGIYTFWSEFKRK
jgi:uncharacterized protein YoxC